MRSLNVRPILEAALLCFIFSLFLTLGSDLPDHIRVRLIFGTILLVAFVTLGREHFQIEFPQQVAFYVLAAFLLFEAGRALWGWTLLHVLESKDHAVTAKRFVRAAPAWLFQGAFFFLSYAMFAKKRAAHHFLAVMAWAAFFLAMNAIPPLLAQSRYGYFLPDGRISFFAPFFFVADWIPQYLMSVRSHVNYAGDLVALGFFPALGMAVYSLQQRHKALLPQVFLYLILALSGAAAILLFFSRGTILTFLLSFLVFLILLWIKFPSRTQGLVVVGIFLGTLGFLAWAGNLQSAWKEIQTLQQEVDPTQPRSLDLNVEGAQRAKAMFGAHTKFGVGTRGYQDHALDYASKEGSGKKFMLADYVAMNHYLHLLAEEGMAAFLYFLFLMAYFFQVLIGFTTVKSRFQCLGALSLAVPVLMILLHASFNHLMERFFISLLVFIAMGASLAMLRPDFQHED